MKKIKASRSSSSFLVGIFVIVGSILLVSIIIWLGASSFLEKNVQYLTYFDGSVEGLDPGSAVKYLGVPVGTVGQIEVAPDGRLIQVTILISKQIEISDSLRVKAEMAGIAGGKFLQLYFPSDTAIAKMYPSINFKTEFPVIRSSPSGIQEIEIAAREIMNNIMKFQFDSVSYSAVNFFTSTSDFFNNQKLFNIISNLENTSSELKLLMSNANNINFWENLDHSSAELYKTSLALKEFSDELNKKLDEINIGPVIDAAARKYDSVMVNTNIAVKNISYRFENALFNLNDLITSFNSTNKQIKRTLQAFTDNPSQILLSNPPAPEK